MQHAWIGRSAGALIRFASAAGSIEVMGYGTGAIMPVPGQDERDWEFAEAFELGDAGGGAG